MSMQRINTYKTTDGSLFEDKTAAEQHQRELYFKEWYEADDVMVRYVDFDTFSAWLASNREALLVFMNAVPKRQRSAPADP